MTGKTRYTGFVTVEFTGEGKMNAYNQDQYSSQDRKRRSPLAFRFGKGKKTNADKAAPFTELPSELKGHRFTLGRLLRGILNMLFMIVLIAALVALVAAFAYALINSPEELAQASYNLVNIIKNFIQSISGAG
jgi:hypothetical protein